MSAQGRTPVKRRSPHPSPCQSRPGDYNVAVSIKHDIEGRGQNISQFCERETLDSLPNICSKDELIQHLRQRVSEERRGRLAAQRAAMRWKTDASLARKAAIGLVDETSDDDSSVYSTSPESRPICAIEDGRSNVAALQESQRMTLLIEHISRKIQEERLQRRFFCIWSKQRVELRIRERRRLGVMKALHQATSLWSRLSRRTYEQMVLYGAFVRWKLEVTTRLNDALSVAVLSLRDTVKEVRHAEEKNKKEHQSLMENLALKLKKQETKRKMVDAATTTISKDMTPQEKRKVKFSSIVETRSFCNEDSLSTPITGSPKCAARPEEILRTEGQPATMVQLALTSVNQEQPSHTLEQYQIDNRHQNNKQTMKRANTTAVTDASPGISSGQDSAVDSIEKTFVDLPHTIVCESRNPELPSITAQDLSNAVIAFAALQANRLPPMGNSALLSQCSLSMEFGEVFWRTRYESNTLAPAWGQAIAVPMSMLNIDADALCLELHRLLPDQSSLVSLPAFPPMTMTVEENANPKKAKSRAIPIGSCIVPGPILSAITTFLLRRCSERGQLPAVHTDEAGISTRRGSLPVQFTPLVSTPGATDHTTRGRAVSMDNAASPPMNAERRNVSLPISLSTLAVYINIVLHPSPDAKKKFKKYYKRNISEDTSGIAKLRVVQQSLTPDENDVTAEVKFRSEATLLEDMENVWQGASHKQLASSAERSPRSPHFPLLPSRRLETRSAEIAEINLDSSKMEAVIAIAVGKRL